MMIVGEPKEPQSFTDETSIRVKGDQSVVWIHAQVYSKDPLEWFHDLRHLYSVTYPELKARTIGEFAKLPADIGEQVNRGLRRSRVHIVDTFAYEAEARQVMREILKVTDYEDVRRKTEDPQVATVIIQGLEDMVAERILLDSPAQRLERNLQAGIGGYGYGRFLAIERQKRRREELSNDLKPYRKRNKRVSDTVAKVASKSASVFSDALEFTESFPIFDYSGKLQVAALLNRSHAFDAGDSKSIETIDEQRKHFIVGTVYQVVGELAPLYGDIDSRLSVHTQAADLCAGLVREIYPNDGLEGVIDRVDYVTFNGERILESNFQAVTSRWNEIKRREERIRALISD